jgi:TP901 family phage tail tape measure protein
VEKIEFRISVIEDQLSKILKQSGEEAEKTRKKIESIGDVVKDVGSEFSKIKASFIGNLGANAVQAAFSGLVGTFKEAVSQARSYSRSIAEINSILPENAKLTEEQSKALIKLAGNYGKTAQEQARAYYEIISSGVEDTNSAFKVLTASNEAAVAGLTSTATASKVLTSAFNAFAQQGTTVTQISDALFQAVKDGQTTFEELSGTLGRVAPIASSVGISINEVAGTIGFLTKSGLQTDQAITGLRSAITAIIKPSADAIKVAKDLNLQFGIEGLKAAGGFAQFLDKVKVATNGSSTAIAKLFGDVNAINAVTSIVNGNFADFNKVLEQNKNALGATAKAAQEVKNSFDFKAAQAEQQFKNLALTLGVLLTPALTTLTTGLKTFSGLFQGGNLELDENRKKLKDLAVEYNTVKDALDLLTNARGASDRQIQESIKVVGSITQGEKRLNEILQERQAIRASAKEEEASKIKPVGSGELPGSVIDPAKEAEALKLRQDTFNQLNAIQTEFDAVQQERKLQQLELGSAENQVEIDKLLALEQAKIDAKYAAEDQKNKLIEDSIARENAIKATGLKKDLEYSNKKTQITKAQTDAQNKLEQQSLQTRLSYVQAFGNLASSIAKDGSKEQFLIQKASAVAASIVATQLAAAQALAVPPSPNLGLAATAKTLGAINTAAIVATAIKGFAGGGIVGSVDGATSGADNRLATVRDGEMVLNADQQKSLFDMINSGGNGGGDIVVQVDGREIARAVRTQLNNGFKFA